MQRMVYKRLSLLIASVATAALMLGGCNGKDGANGTNGLNANEGAVTLTALTAEEQAALSFSGEVTGVTINNPPVVNFKVADANGNPLVGLGVKNAAGTALNNMSFTIAKLVPGNTGSPDKWVNYIVTTTATPALGQKPSTDNTGTLIDNGDGTYQYTFARDIKLAKAAIDALTDSGNKRKADLGDLTYEPNLTHRLGIQIGGNILNTSPSIPFKNPINLTYDFIPATGKVVTTADTQREIVSIEACNECHGKLALHGGGARVEAKYCVLCHTSQRAYGEPALTSVAGAFTPTAPATSTYITDGEVAGEFVTMVHKIHMGNQLSKTGYNYAGVKFEKLGYPGGITNCRKCHKAGTTLQGDNWNLKPSRLACGSCHDAVNFTTGAGHTDGNLAQLNDASCATTCHPAEDVKNKHMGAFKTANNPDILTGLATLTYEISSATVATNRDLTIKFRILKDGVPVALTGTGSLLTQNIPADAVISGFSGSPSFLLAYAKSDATNQVIPLDTSSTPKLVATDYNNLGGVAGQPTTITLAKLLNTGGAATGSIAATTDGYYNATILAASAFPAGSGMRAVALQGYFTQTGFTSAQGAARHTVSVIKAVTGDNVRRTVVDPAKCGKCHEFLDFHGGNRVYETQVCVTCHNPNLSTSGRTISAAKLSAYVDSGFTDFSPLKQAILLEWYPGFDKTTFNSLLFPEFTNNFKELIHGIHAGGDRTDPVRDVRNGSGSSITLINAGDFVYPNLLKNCESCHVSAPAGTNRQTYKANLPANLLPSTNVTQDINAISIANKVTSRTTVPQAQDVVTGPLVGACISCHDTAIAKAHMTSNGAQLGAAEGAGKSNTDLGVVRDNLLTEQCVLCHGEGRVADVVKVHAR